MSNPEKLTSREYWEEYYGAKKAHKESISRMCSYYDKFWDMLFSKNANPLPESLIEIGGYPGRYLAYLADKYKVKPTNLDYNSDAELIKENMKAFEVEDYEIIQTDFFKYEPKRQWDVVISNGFIEHFDDFGQVMDLHLPYVKPGGTLLIMIPNKRNYIQLYKTITDKANLDVHNLNCMKIEIFEKFAEKHGLNTLHLDYYGGFPYKTHQSLNLFQKMIYHPHRYVFKNYLNKWVESNPNKNLSSLIVGVFQRPLNG